MEEERVQKTGNGAPGHRDAKGHLQNKPLLSVRNLKTQYFTEEGVVKAVEGASFDLHMGRTLGIVGESGCGKTVTAKSILRLIEKSGKIVEGEIIYRRGLGTEDEVEIDLVQLEANGPLMRSIRGGEISLIFQEPMTSFSPVYTIGAQIVEAIRLHQQLGKKQAHDLGVDLLRRVGVPLPEQRMTEYSHQLSGGLRQRAMVAMALSCDPVLLIADEPTTAVDVTTQAQILDLLRELQQASGMAVMFITHNLGVIAELADEVMVMYLGLVAERAPVDELFHAAKHPYTQALLRSIPGIKSRPREKLPAIVGAIPHPIDRPSGCPFHPRCAFHMPGMCDKHIPTLREVADGQEASCFLY
jgi:peptide/nickel transport system ATP-binding protein